MTLVGVFDSCDAAAVARVALLDQGVPEHRIIMSAPLTEDGIAAEAPGQSYENQSYEPDPEDSQLARYTEAVLTGACVLSVATEPGKEGAHIKEVMQQKGARIALARPAIEGT